MIISLLRRLLPARKLRDGFFVWRTDFAFYLKRLQSPIVIERIPANFYGYGEYLSLAVLLRSPLKPIIERLSDDEIRTSLEDF